MLSICKIECFFSCNFFSSFIVIFVFQSVQDLGVFKSTLKLINNFFAQSFSSTFSGYTVTFVRKFMEVSYFLWFQVEFEIGDFSLIFMYLNFLFFFFQTIALCGSALFLMLISYTSSYEASLFCLACAVACCGFHGSGILINPQDIAPKHAGSVFGMFVWSLLLFS